MFGHQFLMHIEQELKGFFRKKVVDVGYSLIPNGGENSL